MKPKLIVFDLDGTLIDSLEDLSTALNQTLKDLGLPQLEKELIARHIGSGTKKLLTSVLLQHEHQDLQSSMELFKRHYLGNLVERTYVYPGMIELLDELEGIEKVILTNKMSVYLEPLLGKLDLLKYFSAFYGLEAFPTSKPDPGPLLEISNRHGVKLQEMMIIGDTESDILAGQRAGVQTIAVTWGYGNGEKLKGFDCQFCDRPEAILNIILL